MWLLLLATTLLNGENILFRQVSHGLLSIQQRNCYQLSPISARTQKFCFLVSPVQLLGQSMQLHPPWVATSEAGLP
jgi:hypothetical protein